MSLERIVPVARVLGIGLLVALLVLLAVNNPNAHGIRDAAIFAGIIGGADSLIIFWPTIKRRFTGAPAATVEPIDDFRDTDRL